MEFTPKELEQVIEQGEKAVELNKRYGERLGDAFFDYVYGQPRNFEEVKKARMEFAREVNRVAEGGSGEIAVYTLLEAIEAKIAVVAKQPTRADARTAPIGNFSNR